MKNFVQPGHYLDLVAPSGGVVSGTAYLIGALLVVAQHSAAEGDGFVGVPDGVFTLPKKSTDTPGQGAALYWDNTAKELTTTASGNTKVGAAVKAAGSGETTVVVRLNGAA